MNQIAVTQEKAEPGCERPARIIGICRRSVTGRAMVGQQRQFLALLKNLSNELRLPIIAAGTRDTIRTLHTDPQLSSRFEAFGLPRWKLDREFLRLLASFERLLPLEEPSGLASREMASRLHIMSQGTIGGVARVLERAAVLAIRRGARRIDLPLLSRVGAVKLSDYGKQAEAL